MEIPVLIIFCISVILECFEIKSKKILGLTEHSRPWGDLRTPSRTLKGSRRAGEGLLTRVWSDRTRENGFNLTNGRLRWNIRIFFHCRMVRPWQKRSWSCPIPGNVQAPPGWAFEQPGISKRGTRGCRGDTVRVSITPTDLSLENELKWDTEPTTPHMTENWGKEGRS